MSLMEVSLPELGDYAKQFLASLPFSAGNFAYIIGLVGELGAGKTTFVQHLAKALAVERMPTSPTFVLAQTYRIEREPFKKLVHIDAYRLSPTDTDTLGWREYASDPRNLIVVEWPERLPGGLPDGMRMLSFSVTGENTREITDYVN